MRTNNKYYRLLNKTLKKNINDTIRWLDSGEAIKFFVQRQDRLQTFFDESNLRQSLSKNGESCYENAEELITTIYNDGALRGYRELRTDRVFTNRDKATLNHLLDYNYDLIKSVNSDHILNIRESLIIGAVEGRHPSVIAKDILETTNLPGVNGLSPRLRANMIARTETSRALNEGAKNSYKNYGIEQVDLITANDSSVCDLCLELEENNPHLIDELELPIHPNCRCGIKAHIINE